MYTIGHYAQLALCAARRRFWRSSGSGIASKFAKGAGRARSAGQVRHYAPRFREGTSAKRSSPARTVRCRRRPPALRRVYSTVRAARMLVNNIRRTITDSERDEVIASTAQLGRRPSGSPPDRRPDTWLVCLPITRGGLQSGRGIAVVFSGVDTAKAQKVIVTAQCNCLVMNRTATQAGELI